MFTPPLPRSTPASGLQVHTSTLRATALTPGDASDASRPKLKRQATAPLPFSSTAPTKKRRDTLLDPINSQPFWSDSVHSAFIEALQKHPPIPEWRFSNSCVDTPDDAQLGYCRIIQNYILKKTGCPQSFEEISDQVHLVLSSPLTSPLVKTPIEPNGGMVPEFEPHHADAHSFKAYRQSTGHDIASSLDNQKFTSGGSCSSESPSMSRRRKACNRPVLNLHVDLPSAYPFSPSMEMLADDSHESSSSGLTPFTTSLRPFLSENELNPCTPLEQCHKYPLVPPEIPRGIGVTRIRTDRWIPTPTEGVLPSPSSTIPSPLSTSSYENFDESSDYNSNLSSSTGRMKARPAMPGRATSWLSNPKPAALNHIDASAPANYITSSANSNEDPRGYP